MNVFSADGTPIAFDQRGSGAPVILVGGAFNDRTTVAGLAEVLAGDFTTIAYDRRGRGSSGDAAEYAVEREIEDIAALIAQVGGTASVFGHSSGAILALEAGAAGLAIDKLVAYEPPYTVADRAAAADDLADRVRAAIEAGDRDEAVRLFLVEGAGTPAEMIGGMRADPVWSWFTGLAHTLPYDLAIVGPGGRLPAGRLARITTPVLVVDGSESPSWFGATARAVAEVIPGARHETLAGQDHGVLQFPETLEPLLTGFLKA